jgi:DNA topoisomerase VI subunit A
MLRQLAESAPNADLQCITDWNPSGIHIYATYRNGSAANEMTADSCGAFFCSADCSDLDHVLHS